MLNAYPRIHHRIISAAFGASLLASLGYAPSAAWSWETAHGPPGNTGFVDIATVPAGKGSVTVPGLGAFAPGAGPVIAPDGTVYLGTTQGKLIALHADGKPFWSRDITPGQTIVASPAIASDGSIYVIGVETIRDKRVNPPKVTVTSTLHRFNSSGAWLAQIPFPGHGGIGPAAVASPNIGRFGSIEAIFVPTLYPIRLRGRPMVRLVAFDLNGLVLDDVVMLGFASDITGGSGIGDWELIDFKPRPGNVPLVKVPPTPGIGIGTRGGAPHILASDGFGDVIGYSFTNRRLKETFRLRREGFLTQTPPVVLSDSRAAIGLQGPLQDYGYPADLGGLLLTTPDRTGFVDKIKSSFAAPTRLPDGRIAVVGNFGEVTVVSGAQVAATMQAPGRSIASAAASRTHLFVSAEDGFVTYDAKTLAEVSRIDWVGGGLNPPAIGPQGHVYAIASNILFVFPPPIKKPKTVLNQVPGGLPVATQPGPATGPQQQSYKPPMTANGNRLFACEELDGDDCGKGDYQTIAKAFCVKQGHADAKDHDVDSKKVKAETLDGRYCSKSKCKVFEQIVCANN
ncbi:MAG: PQQ-like beta-propeller repeat protein [Rhodospirillales bacterium]|nr:PQQ-like beta-propeller repeat protein [Rhodospirillales bacterium]